MSRTSLLLLLFISITRASFAVPAEGHKIMISAPSPYGVEVGKQIFDKGGNVVDVAVAIGLTLSVTSPYYAALGGGGFAVVKMGKDQPIALDFREMAPLASSPDFYTKDSNRSSRVGGAAIGVPGNPMGLYDLHKKYGKLRWKALFGPAIKLAEKGFQLSGEWIQKTRGKKEKFSPAGIEYFFKKGGKSYLPGEFLKQPQLAKALRLLRDRGPKGFYTGVVAKDIVKTVKENKGVITLKDLATYKTRWLKPLETSYNGYKLYLMPPPSSGGVVIAQALALVERLNLKKYKFLSVEELHLLGEVQSRSYRGRSLLADPDFHKNPIEKLLNKKELDRLAKSISLKKATTLKPIEESKYIEPGETTHFTVMDSDGNTVSLTTTLNGNYGSGVVSDIYGIALNNEMDDFTTKPGEPNMFGLIQGQGNKVEPGKRPLSSMSPTLVMKDKEVVFALGAPGGPRIISSVFQVIYRVLGQNLDLDLAVQAPRVHHQFQPNTLYVDRLRFSPEILKALKKKGHDVKESWMAKVYAVQRSEDGLLKAAFDQRGEGAAGGY